MFNVTRREINWGDKKLVIENGHLARQANGSVLVSYGNTTVLAAVTYNNNAKPDINFLPLSVHYQEKSYAAGMIPGGFFKREGRPSEKEVLTSRLIDRPLRSMIDSNWRCETQVICMVLSHDSENDADTVALIAAAAAVALSGVPIKQNLAGCRVGCIDGKLVLNPTFEERDSSKLDLFIAGTSNAIVMVESAADEFSEEQMLEAINFGHQSLKPIVSIIDELADQLSIEKKEVPANDEAFSTRVTEIVLPHLQAAIEISDRLLRKAALASAQELVLAEFADTEQSEVKLVLKNLWRTLARSKILTDNKRLDLRDPDQIRQLDCVTSIVAQPHGSAVFTRGETQALATVTLGSNEDEQIIDTLEKNYRETFMLHYNFPSFCTGEVSGRMASPGRREIGHGKLAWRSFKRLLPNQDDFPYTIRVVSEILESNGSSSMATVCATSLALMDAGVPIKQHLAGIAMGLIKEGDEQVILTDISGEEDGFGDMDFKVTGTRRGITALQMDLKVKGIDSELMLKAMKQARAGLEILLNKLDQTIDCSNLKLKPQVPRVKVINISKDKVRDVIGSGGKVIRGICETTNAKISITNEGRVSISAPDPEAMTKAENEILNIACEPEVGAIYTASVVKLMAFGAVVKLWGANEGLLHISEISDKRIKDIAEVLKADQKVKVKVLQPEKRGKLRLTMRGVPQE